MKVYWMSRGNKRYWLWLDIKLGDWWYVFQWIRGESPFLYRSLDATPPGCPGSGVGARMLLGRYSD